MVLKRNSIVRSTAVGALVVLLTCATPARAADPDGTKAMAEHFAQLAQVSVATRPITPETLRQSIALLKAARQLDPGEARFARLLAEAALQAGDSRTAIDAYEALVGQIDRDDRVAQIRLIDLHLGQMHTADARLRYLQRLIDTETVAAEVRSHAALAASRILFERAQHTEAMQRLDDALALFPLNPQALRRKYELTADDVSRHERVAMLLTMLRSNPAQPGVMAKLASEFADVGLHDQAMEWYGKAFGLAHRVVGRGLTPDDADDWVALMLITDQVGAAYQFSQELLKADPQNVDAAFVSLIIARRSGDADRLDQARRDTEQALLGRAKLIRRQLDGEPEDVEFNPLLEEVAEVNVREDVQRLLAAGDGQLIIAYASTLADLAWMHIYFDDQPARAEPVLEALRQLLPADSITLARLEGWIFLASGRPQEARVKLSAVADRDALAELGMIRLLDADPGTQEKATQQARRLMAEVPSGVLGAMIHDALREKKEKLAPGIRAPLSPEASAVLAELDAFPREWLKFLEEPRKFYLLRGEPLKVTHQFEEPIIARVTVRNISKYDITVGPDGAIRPDLWFDVVVRGAVQQAAQGVAFERLSHRVVLKPGDEIVQNVRVDGGQLLNFLRQSAAASMPLFFSVFNNPITVQTGIAPSPGGQRESFQRPVQRAGTQFNEKSIGDSLRELAQGMPATRMRKVDLLLWFGRTLAQAEDERFQTMSAEILAAVRKVTDDPHPRVRAWSSYALARLRDPESRRLTLDRMLADAAWESRMLALVLLQTFDPDEWMTVAEPLVENDPEPLVREFASAVVDFADSPDARWAPPRPEDEQAAPAAEPFAQP